jgi:hypothetical protein
MPVTMRVKFKDNTDLKGKTTRIRNQSLKANRELAEFIRDRAQYYAPFKTGALVRNIFIKFVDKDRFTISAQKPQGARGPYPVFQELGVSARSFSGSGPSGKKWRYIPPRMVEVKRGKTHPGIPSREFMKRASIDGRREAKKIYGQRVRLAIGRNM